MQLFKQPTPYISATGDKIYPVVVDIKKGVTQADTINFMSADNKVGFISVQLVNGSDDYSIIGARVVCSIVRPDKTQLEIPCDIVSSNVIEIPLDVNGTYQVGIHSFDIKIYKDGKTVATPQMNYIVNESILSNDDAITETDRLPILNILINELGELTTRVENAILANTEDLEVKIAREDLSGVLHKNLKSRLDSTENVVHNMVTDYTDEQIEVEFPSIQNEVDQLTSEYENIANNEIPSIKSELETNTNLISEHIANHPSGGGETHTHANKPILDGITSTKVTEWNNKSTFDGNYNSLTNKPTIPTIDVTKSYVDTELSKKSSLGHRHNASEIDGLPSGGSSDFATDWGTIEVASKPQPTKGGFPTDFNNNFVNYGGTYWVAFHNDVDFNTIKVKLTSNKLIASERVRYKYTTSDGTSWSEYTDLVDLYINQGLNNINNSSVDLYDNDLAIIRNKDNYGEIIGDPVEVSMVNGTTSSLDEYVGVNAQLVVDTEKKQIRIMDGVTKGGTVITTGSGGEGGFSGDYNDLINKPTIPPAYTLPMATTNTLGGVKVGSGLSVSNGTISVSSSGGSWIGAKSVLDFGAQPLTDTGGQPSSSAFDNTSAIQQAIDWSNTNRATVYFPRGRYVIKGTLYLKEYCSFKGDNQLPFGYEPYGNWNKNDVVFLCENNVVFRGFGETDTSTSLHETEIALRGINFQHGNPSDSNMLNSIFFHKLQLNRSDIRDCLFRGFGIWLMGAMFMKTYVQHNIFMEIRKYFIQSLSIPNIGNTAGIIDSRVKDNYISGSQSGLVDNIGFYINYPAFSEISGNFIDFWKWGMDIWNGEATSIRDNDFQYCAKGIRIAGASSINIEGNRLGKMNYNSHKSAFTNDVARWGSEWHGIDLEDSVNTITVTNNIGSTIDTLIRMRATTYEKVFINANMGGNTIVDTQHSNDNTKKIFIQEFK